MTKTVTVARPNDALAVVTLSRPEVLNALSEEMMADLHRVLDDLRGDRDCRVAVLTGAGRGFCAGLDLAAFGGAMKGDDDLGPVQAGMHFQQAIASLVTAIRSLPQPVIAAVNGPAAGGGLALALACDTRICSASARFGASFVRLGVSGCDVGVSYILPRLVGPTLAFEMMLTGRLVDAGEAERSGLVLKVVPEESLLEEALDIAGAICANSPFGVWMTKEVMWANLEASSLRGAIDLENRTQILALQTSDAREAAAAFLAKRKPDFRNR